MPRERFHIGIRLTPGWALGCEIRCPWEIRFPKEREVRFEEIIFATGIGDRQLYPNAVSGPDRHTRPLWAFVFRHLVPLTAMMVLDKKSGFDSEGMQAETSVEWPDGWIAGGVVRDDVNAASCETPDPFAVVPLLTGLPLLSADVSD
jgi:hypothetical protein